MKIQRNGSLLVMFFNSIYQNFHLNICIIFKHSRPKRKCHSGQNSQIHNGPGKWTRAGIYHEPEYCFCARWAIRSSEYLHQSAETANNGWWIWFKFIRFVILQWVLWTTLNQFHFEIIHKFESSHWWLICNNCLINWVCDPIMMYISMLTSIYIWMWLRLSCIGWKDFCRKKCSPFKPVSSSVFRRTKRTRSCESSAWRILKNSKLLFYDVHGIL